MSSSIPSILLDKIRKSIASKHDPIVSDRIIERVVLDTLLHRKREYPLSYDDTLKDIKVQSSSYGKTIPKIYGTARISGNIIWAYPIKYTQHRESRDSSYSLKTHISTEYKATLAIAICEGPVQKLLKIWANGKPLDLTKLRYHFYKGTEEQTEDPIMLFIEKRSPAYRGLSYVLIEDLPLHTYNNSIPNFVFEVTSYPERFLENHITKKINCVHTVGLGEFAYDTQLQISIDASRVRGKEITHGKGSPINGRSGKPLSISSLDSLRVTLPNVQWIAVPVHWFADSINIKECHIYPSTTYSNVKTLPDEWSVGRFIIKNTITIPSNNGQPIYPGTTNDASLVRYLRKLKSRGYKIMLSLKLVVISTKDPQIQYTNSDLTGDPSAIEPFFMNKYHEFLEHYSILTRGLIDALVIGDSFGKLTKIQNTYGEFPAVTSLIKLAAYAKSVAGSKVIVTYAANWDEYHSHDGVYNMDPLWACDSIDVIGIKAYFPLTDGNTSSSGTYDPAQAWNSGEGYNYFYDNEKREKKIPFESELTAWKNIQHWWRSLHDKESNWVPASKKIWFIEYGFRSVENCTNFQPLSGYDHSITDSSSSTESCSFSAQRVAITDMLHMWESSHMVEKMFLYAWDLGFSDFSTMSAGAYVEWKTGYSINRKIDIIPASAVLQDVLMDAPQATVKCADTSVPGYLINNQKSIYDVLMELQKIYSFHIAEGTTALIAHDMLNVIEVSKQDVVSQEYSAISTIENLYDPPTLSYISMKCNYQPRLVQSHLGVRSAANVLQMSIVLDDEQAARALDAITREMSKEKLLFKIVLPIKYASLAVGDMIKIGTRTIQVTDIKIHSFLLHIEGHSKTPGSCA